MTQSCCGYCEEQLEGNTNTIISNNIIRTSSALVKERRLLCTRTVCVCRGSKNRRPCNDIQVVKPSEANLLYMILGCINTI